MGPTRSEAPAPKLEFHDTRYKNPKTTSLRLVDKAEAYRRVYSGGVEGGDKRG